MGKLTYKVIKSDGQYFKYAKRLEELVNNGLNSQDAVDEYELLYLLIRNWDDEHRLAPELDPVELIKSLMEGHKLTQNDLAEIAGVGKSYISEILNYKKRMSKNVIRKLADHFKIQQSSLNKVYRLEDERFENQYSVDMGADLNNMVIYEEISDGLNPTTHLKIYVGTAA